MPSAINNASDPRQQERIAERYRQLRSRVDRARPTYEQYTRGELKVLSNEQKKLVAEYPAWLEDLDELRQGRVPAPRAKLPAPADAAGAQEEAPATEDEQEQFIPGNAPVAKGKKSHNGHKAAHVDAQPHIGKKGGKPAEDPAEAESEEPAEGAADEEPEDDIDGGAIATEEDLIATLQAIRSRPVQLELISGYITRFMKNEAASQKECADLEKKLAGAEGLKKKIISGAVKRPSNAQLSMIEQLPSLRKQLTAARKKAKKEEQQLRDGLLKHVVEEEEEEEEVEEDEEAEEPTAHKATGLQSREATPPPAEEEAEEAEEAVAVVAVKEEVVEVVEVVKDNEVVEEVVAREEVVVVAEADAASAREEEEEEQPQAESEPRADDEDENLPVQTHDEVPDAVEEAEVPEAAEIEEEPARAATPPPPPPPPANITVTPGFDWSKLTFVRSNEAVFTLDTFMQLAGPSQAKPSSPTTASAAAATSTKESDATPDATADTTEPTVVSVPSTYADNSLHYLRAHLPVGAAAGASAAAVVPATSSNKEEVDEGDAEDAAAARPREWLARIDRECEALRRHPVPRVTVCAVSRRARAPGAAADREGERRWVGARPEEDTQWHVTVSPADGPLAGQPVHLTVTFPPAYPFVPPQVRCLVSMPHKGFMVSQAGQANTLFLTYRPHHLSAAKHKSGARASSAAAATTAASATAVAAAIATGGWLPDMSARVVMQELQSFFDADSFTASAEAFGAAHFNQEMQKVRVALAASLTRCPLCAAAVESEEERERSAPTYINGPFLQLAARRTGSPTTPAAGEEEADEPEEGSAGEADDADGSPEDSAAADGQRGKKGGRAAKAVYATAAARQGAVQGPFEGCWANLLYTGGSAVAGAGAAPSAAHAFLHLAASTSAELPVVELYALPPSLLRAAAPKSRHSHTLSTAAARVLARGDGAAKPIWTLPAAAWVQDGKVASCTLRFAADGESSASASPSVHEVPLPVKAEATPFAVVLRVPGEGQRVTAVVAASAAAARAAAHSAGAVSCAAHTPSAPSDEVAALPALWQGLDALLEGEGADASAKGIVVGIPYGFGSYADLSAAGEGRGRGADAPALDLEGSFDTYYLPRRVRFHLMNGQLPAVLSEEVFAHYKTLIANLRRYRGSAAVHDADSYLATAPNAVVRRQVLPEREGGDAKGKTGGAGGRRGGAGTLATPSAVTALSDFFMGLRVLYIPLEPSAAQLETFKSSCVQLYRNPSASTRYTPPYRPLCVLHVLSLVLRQAMEVCADKQNAGTLAESAARGVVRRVLALAHRLTKETAHGNARTSFRALCEEVAAAPTPAPNAPLLFQASPMVPLSVLERVAASARGELAGEEELSLRSEALRELSFAMGAVPVEEAAAYETELQVAATLIATAASGSGAVSPAAAHEIFHADHLPNKKGKKWTEAWRHITADSA